MTPAELLEDLLSGGVADLSPGLNPGDKSNPACNGSVGGRGQSGLD